MSHIYYVNQYISELDIKFLPGGMLVKSDTGMGATHFELVSPRHSIIVEPIRVTAASKVQSAKNDKTYLQDRIPFYVGSAINETASPTDKEISQYLSDKNKVYKKFICVADSLYRVMEGIAASEGFSAAQFFMLIDEVDSIQMDSSFRRKIEDCLDYYAKQPSDMRAMLTATPLEFSNPFLKKEPITRFQMNTSISMPTILVNTGLWWQCIISRIHEIRETDSDKIVVVLNSIHYITILIQRIINSGIDTEDIAVLCSAQSQEYFPDHFEELNDTVFPQKINIITSAYFSGYDIKENYHLICYASFLSDSTMLSPAQIKQIYGRCRKPFSVLSHLIVFRPRFPDRPQTPPKKPKKDREIKFVSTQGLLDEAKAVINIEKCFKLNYPKNQVGGLDILNNFRAILVDALNDKNLNSVRINKEKMVISYFFIDSKVENYNVYLTFYAINADPVARLTEAGMTVTSEKFSSEEKLQPGESTFVNIKKSKLIEKLKSLLQSTEIEITEEFEKMGKSNYPLLSKRILSFIIQLKYYFPLVDVIKEAIESMTKDGMPRRDNRAFNNWLVKKYFQTADVNTPLRIFVNHFFKQGEMLTSEEVASRMKDCIIHAQLKTLIGVTSKTLITTDGKNGKELVTLAGNFIELKRHRKQGGGSLFRVIEVFPVMAKRSLSEVGMTGDELFFSKGERKIAFG